MTLHSQDEFSIPEETGRVAHAVYPKGHVSLKMRDALGTIYQDQTFAHLFPHNRRSAEADMSTDHSHAIHGRTARPTSR